MKSRRAFYSVSSGALQRGPLSKLVTVLNPRPPRLERRVSTRELPELPEFGRQIAATP